MLTANTTENAYELALQNFDAAADAMGLDDDTRTMIKFPERVLTVSVPVRLTTFSRSTSLANCPCALRRTSWA
jgi:glutamate dehydrogenase (NAD(P)+)/glutamate dehydrogenase (NADP+)